MSSPIVLVPDDEQDLPYECPACGQRFGYGRDANALPAGGVLAFVDQKLPCCQRPITGALVSGVDGVRLELRTIGEAL